MENRVIKFRVFGSEYMSQPFTLFDLMERKVEFTKDTAVMQFTGLTDKNGKEIYEGDVLRFWNGKIGEVVYDFLDVIVDDNDRADILCFCIRIGKHRACIESTDEVIGNVFQHSNLLK